MIPRVKICCISSSWELATAVAHGASAVGLVSAMPSGPGVIDEPLIAQLARETPPGVASFLLTSLQSASAIVDQHQRTRTSTVQICDAVPIADYASLRAGMPGAKLVQVIHVEGEAALDEALQVAPHVDAILLDSGRPNQSTKELGGTGRVHDWRVSQKIREQVGVPIYLAGGLHPNNVRRAIDEVGPFGLDLCSSVRTEGVLDPRKLEAFFRAVRA
ncbi:N-(5'phosphoribosyl)anthranilate isomerase (PRAI) [Pirellula staleyi DSM 6068]|uniref:N-(5'-phosphoribosyl)anthranilate isomerase n=1 Tax=Pirellula staleyi (strain ATCC 27377 / DSM 6068 / ICPB 4128) TaxID=530564 RepID=D2QWN8_PIRSD|nr:phosphoribosylanthranilate isomerase [Pirellula staleyi]ADB17841.1 N-(5'phosphoribosyl)anthranilate isomerase (PRAI) [Pirellula staleyi DSM 6068]